MMAAMQIAIISGSHRPQSQSSKVAHFVAGLVEEQHPSCRAEVIELAGNIYPLWDEGVWDKTERWRSIWEPTADKLRASDALVVVSPEWSGMVPSGLKNFLLLCSPRELGDKPGMIVGVSSGMGGSYPVAELRMSGYKNNFICWTPHHVIIRYAEKVLNPGPPATPEDAYLRGRLANSLAVLIKYAEGLRLVRESGVIDRQKYAFGM